MYLLGKDIHDSNSSMFKTIMEIQVLMNINHGITELDKNKGI